MASIVEFSTGPKLNLKVAWLYMQHILQRASKIRLLICDVDGVFTDGTLYFSNKDDELKAFHIQDGLGIKLLLSTGIEVAVITSRTSSLVQRRMQELGIKHIYQGFNTKLIAYKELLLKLNLKDKEEEIAYVGDDLPDLPLILRVGLGIAVANAVSLVKQHAHWQTQKSGGQGAIREICEFIMLAQNTLHASQKEYLIHD